MEVTTRVTRNLNRSIITCIGHTMVFSFPPRLNQFLIYNNKNLTSVTLHYCNNHRSRCCRRQFRMCRFTRTIQEMNCATRFMLQSRQLLFFAYAINRSFFFAHVYTQITWLCIDRKEVGENKIILIIIVPH